MCAAFAHPTPIEHDDLVHLLQAVKLMGDEQGGPAPGRGKQVRRQRPPRPRVEVCGRLVEDQQLRSGEQRPRQRDPLPLTAGDGRAVRADGCVPAPRQPLDPGQQPRRRGGVRQFPLARPRAGQLDVLPDRGVEDVGILRTAADQRADVVGTVPGQVGAAQRGTAAGELAEPQQQPGHGRLSGAAGTDQGDPPASPQIEVDPVEGERLRRVVAHPRPPQHHLQRPGGQRQRVRRVGHRLRRVEDIRHPPRGRTGLAERYGGAGQRGDGLEGGQCRQDRGGERHPAQRPGRHGGHPEQQHGPDRDAGNGSPQPGPQALPRAGRAGQPGQVAVGGHQACQRIVAGAKRVQIGSARQHVGEAGAEPAAGSGGAAPGPAAAGKGKPGHQQSPGRHPGREHDPGWGRHQQPDGRHRADPDHRGRERRPGPAQEQLLGGVDVTDQPGEQVPGTEFMQPGRCEPLQPPVHPHPQPGQDPERDVVGGQSFGIAEDPAPHAEGAHRDHGGGDRDDRRVL